MNTIQIATGHTVDLNKPVWPEISIEQVASTLNRINRFSGNTAAPWSVMQHSALCARFVPERLKPYALLHDASEIVIGDIPSPVKAMIRRSGCDELDRVEARLMAGCLAHFGLKPLDALDLAQLKRSDQLALAVEALSFMPSIEPYDFDDALLAVARKEAEASRRVEVIGITDFLDTWNQYRP